MPTIWVSNEAQAFLAKVMTDMEKEGMGKPSHTDAVMRLSKHYKPKQNGE